MAEKTKIEWCDATFNPFIGCQEVSTACDHCYARVMNERWGWVDGWGPHGERKRTSPETWKKPLQWAKAARLALREGDGTRPRVFCASLADVFDNKVPVAWRTDLWNLILKTPELDWLLLTKRPQNIAKMLPSLWVQGGYFPNVWLGTTAEDDKHYKQRWNVLSRIPAAVHFISHEPALGPLGNLRAQPSGKFPDWIIMGGESGSGARMMERQWAEDMRDACEVAGIAFFMKQMTGKKSIPDDLMVRQFPTPRRLREAA